MVQVDEVVDPLARLRDAVEELLAADPVALAEGDLVLGLAAQVARLELVASQQATDFAAGVEWSVEGAYNASSWVTAKARCPRWLARRRERLGRAVREMPHTAAAWSAGSITADHVDVLAAARTPKVIDTFKRDEQMLVGFAVEMSHAKFVQAVEYWVQQATPDDAEKRAEAQREQRAVFNSQSYQGLWFGKLTLDPIGGEIFDQELRRIEQLLFREEWARVKAALGRDPIPGELERTAAQRRADALVEMATRSRTAPKHGKRPAPLFTVLVDYDTLAGRVCELASRTVVTPGALVPWLDAAYVERIVFDGQGRLLDVGKRRRFFRGGKRRGIQVRDRECSHELCEEPAENCEVDHVEPFAAGGETTLENGRAMCAFHNRQRNARRRAEPAPPPGREGDPPSQ
jgi:Domain of unknown function (DUF222)